MKKKLIQILMLLVTTVSVGSLVSCKDTNEDLYNELRTQAIADNASLTDALKIQEGRLNDMIEKYQNLLLQLQGINSCPCDLSVVPQAVQDAIDDAANDVSATLTASFLGQINEINDLIETLATLENIEDMATTTQVNGAIENLRLLIEGIQNGLNTLESQNLQTQISANLVAQNALEKELNDLKKALNELKAADGYDIIQRLTKVEEALIGAESRFSTIEENLTTAQATANNAYNLATTANVNATQALALAQAVETIANTANNNAATALQAANDAWEIAGNALSAANTANSIATQALTLAQANEAQIKSLQSQTNNLKNLIDDNKTELLNKIGANTSDIAANARDIANNAANIEKNYEAIDQLRQDLKEFNTTLSAVSVKADEAYKKAEEAAAAAAFNRELIATLQESVAANESAINCMKSAIQELNDAVSNLNGLEAKVGINAEAIECLKNSVGNLSASVDDLSVKYGELNDKLNALEGQIGELRRTCEQNLASAKAYVDTEIKAAQLAIMAQLMQELEKYYNKETIDAKLANCATTEDLYKAISDLTSNMTASDQAIGKELFDLAQRVTANETDIEWIKKMLECYCEKFKDFVPRAELDAWFQRIINLENNSGSVDIETLKEQLTSELTTIINNEIVEKLQSEAVTNTITERIEAILGGDDFGFVTTDDLADLIQELIEEGKITGITSCDCQDELADAVDTLKEWVKTQIETVITGLALEATYVKYDDYQLEVDSLWNTINGNNVEISELSTTITTIASNTTALTERIDSLKEDVNKAEVRLTVVETGVQNLRQDVTAIQNYLAQQITGITIQGTHNPMFGTFSIPVNIQSNVLIAFYGIPDNPVEFPTMESDSYVRKDECLTEEDWEMLEASNLEVFTAKANKPLINDDGNGKANAGKIYVTVNPTSVNASGLNLDIVNTQDEESLIKLTSLKKSYETLEFGYSRANNGFYEANAYISKGDLDDVERPFSKQSFIDLGKDAKEQFSEIVSGKMSAGHTGLDELAISVYQVIRGLRLDQSGIKCPFLAPDGKEQAVYSQYNLAATAVKPLGINFGSTFNYQTIPGYERAERLLDRISRTLKSRFATALHTVTGSVSDIVDGLDIQSIRLVDLKDETVARFEITIGDDVTIDGLTYHMQLPADAPVSVMFAQGVTYNGQPVSIPEELTIDTNNPTVQLPTIVVYDDIVPAATGTVESISMKMVIPVTNDAITKYVWYDLNDETITLQRSVEAGDVLTIDNKSVARFDASAITVGYSLTPMLTAFRLSEMVDLSSGTTPTLHLSFTYDLREEMAEVWSNSQDAVKNVRELIEDLLANINSKLELINSYETKFNNTVDNFLGEDSKLHNFLDRVNTVIVNAVNGICWQLGPFIVAEDVNGFKVLSTSKGMPTTMENSKLRLYATSKNMEIVVPFARKHVAVTNVYKGNTSAQEGDEDCLNKLIAANTGDLNKVIEGTQRVLDVTGMERGYVYEIAYSVLDFKGNISTRKTYLRVK